MLLDLKKISGHKLAASNGEIGHIEDFYFDDKTWAVRYLVVDAGSWLVGREVLLTPHALGRFDQDEKILPVNLTRKQIENSPPIAEHRPVSRQFEENYYRYYGWPNYWEGGQMWGMADYPVPMMSAPSALLRSYEYSTWDDIHLRSTKAVTGYEIQGTDGTLGTVTGFMVDDRTWAIRELVVDAGHWYSGKEVLITTPNVSSISYPQSTVFVNLSKADIAATADHDVAMAGGALR